MHSIYPTNLPKPLFHTSQHPPLYQSNTHHTSQHTHTDLHHQIMITHSNTAHPNPHLHPYSHPKLQPIYHNTHPPDHFTKPSKIPHINLHLPQPPRFPYSATTQTHTQYHAKDKNQMTKTTPTNTTHPPQNPSHNTRHKHNQNFNTLQHKHNKTNTIKPQYITTSTNNIATTSRPMPLLFHRKTNPAIMELLMQGGNQSRHR